MWMFAPTTIGLQGLFRDPSMFDSDRDWRKAGFEVVGKGRESDIMVASHPSAPGYLFKKYSKKVSPKDQLENYRSRVEGATKLREFITARHLTKIAVPRKHLHELPAEFTRKKLPAYVLVVERLALLDRSTSRKRYSQIDDEALRQLCAVVGAFPGLDSGARNMPLTQSGQIAFVDTESWDKKADKNDKKGWLRHIRAYLSNDQRRLVDALRQAQ
jgi:hypothetical protein